MRANNFKKNLNTRLYKDMILLGFLSSLTRAGHSVIRSGSAETEFNLMSLYKRFRENIIKLSNTMVGVFEMGS